MASQLLGIKTRFTNDLGSPLVGGQVYTYFAGTSTNQDTYSDAALTVPNTNPVILDDTGSADIFLKGSYRIRVFDKSGRFIEEQDNVTQAASQGDATELNNKIITLESGLSTANADIGTANTEISKVKLDTGITATAKFGGVERGLSDRLADYVSINDFVSVADAESKISGKNIDLLGKSMPATKKPSANKYYNGYLIIDGFYHNQNSTGTAKLTDDNVVFGINTPELPLSSKERGLIAIGNGSMSTVTGTASRSIAIGTRSMGAMGFGKHNIGIGWEAQYSVNGVDSTNEGTRNVSIGDNSLRFNVVGQSNIAMGRNAGQAILSSNNVAIGGDSMAGRGSLQFKNSQTIKNMTPITAGNSTAVGRSTLYFGGGGDNTAIGMEALKEVKSRGVSNTAVGTYALKNLGVNSGNFGGTLTTINKSGTYVMSPTSVIITVSSVTVKAGDYIVVRFDTGIPLYDTLPYKDNQYYLVKSVSGSSITVDEPDGIVASGNVTLISVEDLSVTPANTKDNTAVGLAAMGLSTIGDRNTAIGLFAGYKLAGYGNIAVGFNALANHNSSTGGTNIALGLGALNTMVDGSDNTSTLDAVGIGDNSRVSGNSQIQLGKSSQSVYAFGAVQDRSDARDKIIEGDITDAHIAFFNNIEFKRYRLDYRDDYIKIDDDGNVTKLAKDGSKARKREHVGVIAQQVEQAMQAHNVDFAGLQHHAVNGGNDVYTVGYQEFIPILGEIVQRQQKQIDELMALIKK